LFVPLFDIARKMERKPADEQARTKHKEQGRKKVQTADCQCADPEQGRFPNLHPSLCKTPITDIIRPHGTLAKRGARPATCHLRCSLSCIAHAKIIPDINFQDTGKWLGLTGGAPGDRFDPWTQVECR
jgi:hypothetical protein